MKLVPEDATARKWWIGGSAAGVMLVASVVAWALWPSAPAPDGPPAEVAKYVASEDFAKLAADEKKPYLDAMEKLSWDDRRKAAEQLTEDERGRAMRNFFADRMNKQLDEYFALPAGPQRVAYLDKFIDEGEKRRAEWEKRRAAEPNAERRGGGGDNARGRDASANATGPRGGRGAGPSASRMNQMIQNTPPARRAQMSQFIAELQKRREARGLPAGGGWGGGFRRGS